MLKKSDYKRGDFILSRMQLYILQDLGRGKLTADPENKNKPQAGDVFDLMVQAKKEMRLFSNGVTIDRNLSKNEYYLKALEDWKKVLENRQKLLEEKHGIIANS